MGGRPTKFYSRLYNTAYQSTGEAEGEGVGVGVSSTTGASRHPAMLSIEMLSVKITSQSFTLLAIAIRLFCQSSLLLFIIINLPLIPSCREG